MIRDNEKRILQWLSVFPFLTVQQVTRLLFRQGSASYASTLLKGLWQQEYVDRRSLPSIIRAGSVPWIYSLATKGRWYLRHKGYDFKNHSYPSRLADITDYDDLRHDRGVTDFLIAGYLLAKQHQDIVLMRIIHDRLLRARQQSPVVFDGWMEFLIRGNEQQCIAVEYERSIKDVETFEEKIAATLRLLAPDPLTGESQYEEIFGTSVVTIAYITPISPAYAREMQTRTEKVLEQNAQKQDADVFRFQYIPAGPVDPRVYYEQSWSRPGDTQLVPLVTV